VWGLDVEGGYRDVGARRAVTVLVLFGALILGGCGGSNPRASYATLVGEGVKLLQQGDPNGAIQRFQQAVARNNASPVAHYDLGVAYQQQGNVQQAKREYGLAIHYDPSYVPALYNQAGLFADTFPPLAIFYYRRIIRIKPNSPTTYLNLGLVEAGWPPLRKQALRDLAVAVKLDPTLRAKVPASLRASLPAPK
jgi:tetratricopeptide (TPR) repeat protein